MPVVKGRFREKSVEVLRDTGCNRIVVKKDPVSENQFTGNFNVMLLIDNTARKVSIAGLMLTHPISRVKWKLSVFPMLFIINFNCWKCRRRESC